MDNYSLPPNQHVHISIDMYILLAMLAVMLVATILQVITQFKIGELIKDLLYGLFIVVTLGCVIVVCWRCMVTIQYPMSAHPLSASAALGSTLFAFLAIAVDKTGSGVVVVALLITALFAVIILGILIYLFSGEFIQENREQEKHLPERSVNNHRHSVRRNNREPMLVDIEHSKYHDNQVVGYLRRDVQKFSQDLPFTPAVPDTVDPIQSSIPGRLTVPPRAEQAQLASPGGMIIVPTQVENMEPLFKDDELYAIPQPAKVRLFIRAKSNDILENCEDACAISEDETCIALCDGVSSSKFSRPWARLLAISWIEKPLTTQDFTIEALGSWLDRPRKLWENWVRTVWFSKINERNSSLGRILFSDEDLRKFVMQGSAATFLGFTMNREKGSWQSVAVGDTCLFHFFRSGTNWAFESFPYKSSQDFTDMPASITTSATSVSTVVSNIMSSKVRKYRPEDMFIIATDALAKWVFLQLEHNRLEDIIEYFALMDDHQFGNLVDQQRELKRLDDDDTTLIIIGG